MKFVFSYCFPDAAMRLVYALLSILPCPGYPRYSRYLYYNRANANEKRSESLLLNVPFIFTLVAISPIYFFLFHFTSSYVYSYRYLYLYVQKDDGNIVTQFSYLAFKSFKTTKYSSIWNVVVAGDVLKTINACIDLHYSLRVRCCTYNEGLLI